MRQKIAIGNWKMHGMLPEVSRLLHDLRVADRTSATASCVICPPAIYISLAQQVLQGSGIGLGAQNVYPKKSGSYTGEISAPMLRDYGCEYVLVGHSERRQLFHEDEHFVAEKFHHVKDHGMIPVLCVGETAVEHEQGLTETVLMQQLEAVAKQGADFFDRCVIAYEPVWAIGTGKTATPEHAQTVHAWIRSVIARSDLSHAKTVPILYGGSVNQQNARALFEMPDVDGGLIGGASLHAAQFVEILKCINFC